MTAALEIWRRLAPLVGLAIIPLAILLGIAKMDVRHWHKQSDRFEQLYHGEQTAHAVTVANYRAAAETARKLDLANAARVAAEQKQINERTSDDYQARLAAARAHADRLRLELAATAANPGGGRTTPVPGVPAPFAGSADATGQDGLSAGDALTATEQAIQLDELIKWIRRQHAVDPNGKAPDNGK